MSTLALTKMSTRQSKKISGQDAQYDEHKIDVDNCNGDNDEIEANKHKIDVVTSNGDNDEDENNNENEQGDALCNEAPNKDGTPQVIEKDTNPPSLLEKKMASTPKSKKKVAAPRKPQKRTTTTSRKTTTTKNVSKRKTKVASKPTTPKVNLESIRKRKAEKTASTQSRKKTKLVMDKGKKPKLVLEKGKSKATTVVPTQSTKQPKVDKGKRKAKKVAPTQSTKKPKLVLDKAKVNRNSPKTKRAAPQKKLKLSVRNIDLNSSISTSVPPVRFTDNEVEVLKHKVPPTLHQSKWYALLCEVVQNYGALNKITRINWDKKTNMVVFYGNVVFDVHNYWKSMESSKLVKTGRPNWKKDLTKRPPGFWANGKADLKDKRSYWLYLQLPTQTRGDVIICLRHIAYLMLCCQAVITIDPKLEAYLVAKAGTHPNPIMPKGKSVANSIPSFDIIEHFYEELYDQQVSKSAFRFLENVKAFRAIEYKIVTGEKITVKMLKDQLRKELAFAAEHPEATRGLQTWKADMSVFAASNPPVNVQWFIGPVYSKIWTAKTTKHPRYQQAIEHLDTRNSYVHADSEDEAVIDLALSDEEGSEESGYEQLDENDNDDENENSDDEEEEDDDDEEVANEDDSNFIVQDSEHDDDDDDDDYDDGEDEGDDDDDDADDDYDTDE